MYTHAAYTHKTYTHAMYTVTKRIQYSTERILNILYSPGFSLFWCSIYCTVPV
jgi:hypothetical protein